MRAGSDRPSPPRFSIAVLARNEAPSLPHLFRGLQRFVARDGELLVIDTGSTDETVASRASMVAVSRR
jgi:glycosyltransferase involved in cell wall biosynthesis